MAQDKTADQGLLGASFQNLGDNFRIAYPPTGGMLIHIPDLTREDAPYSKSGKSKTLATTHGNLNTTIPGVKFSLSVYRQLEKDKWGPDLSNKDK